MNNRHKYHTRRWKTEGDTQQIVSEKLSKEKKRKYKTVNFIQTYHEMDLVLEKMLILIRN